MSNDFNVSAQLRTDLGKGASRRLRRAGLVPAIIYGADKEPQALTLNLNEITHSLEQEAFYSHILNVSIDGKSEQAILKDIQRHPAKEEVNHVDFLRIDANHQLHVSVPLHFINEEKAVGVKHGGNVSHLLTEINIACLPKDLPEFVTVDVSGLDVGESLHISDVQLPEGVTSVELSHGEEHDLPVVSVVMPRGEKTEEAADDSEEGAEE